VYAIVVLAAGRSRALGEPTTSTQL
jgi:hypothetical protein